MCVIWICEISHLVFAVYCCAVIPHVVDEEMLQATELQSAGLGTETVLEVETYFHRHFVIGWLCKLRQVISLTEDPFSCL